MKVQRIKERGWYTQEGAAIKGAHLSRRLLEKAGNRKKLVLLTLTLDPEKHADEAAGYEWGSEVLRRVMYDLRQYLGEFEHMWKLETQENGWPHWHILIFRGGVPRHQFGEVLRVIGSRWLAGSSLQGIDLKRVDVRGVKYLCKYVSKSQIWPDWMLDLCRIRIYGTSKGFWGALVSASEKVGDKVERKCEPLPPKTYRERLENAFRSVILWTNNGWGFYGRLNKSWFDYAVGEARDVLDIPDWWDLESGECRDLCKELGAIFQISPLLMRGAIPF